MLAKLLKNVPNISSVLMQSWNPARLALIVLVMLSNRLLKIESPKAHETICVYGSVALPQEYSHLISFLEL
jgi:hypothetical protein